MFFSLTLLPAGAKRGLQRPQTPGPVCAGGSGAGPRRGADGLWLGPWAGGPSRQQALHLLWGAKQQALGLLVAVGGVGHGRVHLHVGPAHQLRGLPEDLLPDGG